jgi:ABC-2 type transport system ATP-binding protein
VTVLYTTHYMEEAQELSDHIAIMDQGEIIACGTHEELVRIVGEQDRIELQLDRPAPEVIAEWQKVPAVQRVTSENGTVTVLAPDSNQVLPHLFELANDHRVRITNVAIQEPNLETVFLHLTGRALRD